MSLTKHARPQVRRFREDWETLSNFRDPALPGWTRRAFSPEYLRAREWLARTMAEADLETSIDAGGNLIGHRSGSASLPSIVIGSHSDTVAGGGRFDGIVGVLAAVEVARALRDSGGPLRHPVEIADWLAEEPTDFGMSMVGSRAVSGTLSAEALRLMDANGATLADAIRSAGGEPTLIGDARRLPGSIALYLELHIEQGPRLATSGHRVGVVTAITGVTRHCIEVVGRRDHVGGTPMDVRRDALAGAAEAILTMESFWQDGTGVGTVGRITVDPNATNVVAERVQLWTDMRSIDADRLEQVRADLPIAVAEIAVRRELSIQVRELSHERPVQIDTAIQERLEAAAASCGAEARRLPSLAGHDANQLAKVAPTGMLFVPSKEGRSHCPEEWTDLEDIEVGLQVLTQAVVDFDRECD